MEELNPELEDFRQQWRAEVTARSQSDGNKSGSSKVARRLPPTSSLSAKRLGPLKEAEDEVEPPKIPGLDGVRDVESQYGSSSRAGGKEPQSALEHYEKAVERETQGSLGDSLDLYRKAFRVCG
jgi:F-box protein 9